MVLGYFLAEPMDSGSVTVVVFLLVILAVPLMMKWHHALLVLSWNAWVTPQFLPGQPYLWMMMAPASLLFAVLNRSVKPDYRFVSVPSVTKPLLFFAGVVGVTAMLTGGIGFHSLGAARHGGKGYLYIFAAVAGYFGLVSQRIPAQRVGLYLAMFFLPGITSLVANFAYWAGPGFYFLFSFFPSSFAMEQAMGEYALDSGSIFRIGGLAVANLSLSAFLLARYGIRGVLDLSKPWRGLLFLLAVAGCAACGFRSNLILFGLTFCILFYLEGLHRTRFLAFFVGLSLAGAAVILPLADKMPLVVQRTLSFLPAAVDPIVQQSATSSSEWRWEIWKTVLPDIPKYLLKGKGYSMDPRDLEIGMGPRLASNSASVVGGEYHNGPLSVIIPFGIFGVLGFGWFLTAVLRLLYHNYQYGDPRLKQANTFLLTAFIAKTAFFCVVFGSLYTDFFVFTGLAGLSVSLNGEAETEVAEEKTEESLEALETLSFEE